MTAPTIRGFNVRPPTGRGTRRSRITTDEPWRRQGFRTFPPRAGTRAAKTTGGDG